MTALLASADAWILLAKAPYAILTIVVAWLSFWLSGLAMRTLPVGTADAVWTGIGASGAAILGVLLFGEPASLARVVCIGLTPLLQLLAYLVVLTWVSTIAAWSGEQALPASP
jgi:quaternary ammonium compound-resistance protein SugE